MIALGLALLFCLGNLVSSQQVYPLNIRDKDKICTAWFNLQAGASISYTQNRECVTGVSWERNANNQTRLCCTGMPLTTPSTNFPKDCGRQQYQPHKQRIVGGHHATANSWVSD